MARDSLERKISFSFGVVIAFGLLVVGLATWSAVHLLGTLREVDVTNKTLIDTEKLLTDLFTAETYVRGYLLRGDERWLETYHERAERLGSDVANLRTKTADSSRNQQRLNRFERVLSQELEVLDTRVLRYKTGGLEAVLETGSNTPGDGRLRVAVLRDLLQEIETDALNRLQARTQRAHSAAVVTISTAVGATLLSSVFLVGSAATVRRDFRLRRQAEESLRLSEERLRLMVDSVQDYAIILLNPDGTVAKWNPGCERITGHSAADIVGQPLIRFDPPPGKSESLLQNHLNTAATHGHAAGEGWLSRRDGSRYWANVVASPARGPEGQLIGFAVLVCDLTARREAEERIRQQNLELEKANHELNAFTYSVSHDLRSPLRGIDGWSLALMEDGGGQLDDRSRLYLHRIRTETQRMGRLIDDLLSLSRISKSPMATAQLDLSALAETIAARLREANPGRVVHCTVQPGLQARGDEGLLTAALTNLFENAWKFTRKVPAARIELSQLDQHGETVFCLRDNGAGFDMAYAAKLFAPFQRLHKMSEYAGTGIGLAIAQRILARHGGRIWAEAEVDRGAAFFFTLPGSTSQPSI